MGPSRIGRGVRGRWEPERPSTHALAGRDVDTGRPHQPIPHDRGTGSELNSHSVRNARTRPDRPAARLLRPSRGRWRLGRPPRALVCAARRPGRWPRRRRRLSSFDSIARPSVSICRHAGRPRTPRTAPMMPTRGAVAPTARRANLRPRRKQDRTTARPAMATRWPRSLLLRPAGTGAESGSFSCDNGWLQPSSRTKCSRCGSTPRKGLT